MSRSKSGSRPIGVRLTGDLPCCPHCGQQALIAASVPHGWTNPDGTVTQGTMPVVLCAKCDHDSPEAGSLIVYLLVHEQITPETLHECAALIQRWVESITIPAVNEDKLEEEFLAWRRGEL